MATENLTLPTAPADSDAIRVPARELERAFHATAEVEALLELVQSELQDANNEIRPTSEVRLRGLLKTIRRANSAAMSIVMCEDGRLFEDMYHDVHDRRFQEEASHV